MNKTYSEKKKEVKSIIPQNKVNDKINDTTEKKITRKPVVKIQNIVASSDLGGRLDLNEVAMMLGLENIEYEPEQFPGLVYRIKEPRAVLLLFRSGKVVCTGARTIDDVSAAVERLHQELVGLGLLKEAE
jgi:transcription initiation factor TFIID TATA-box-binding protein